MAKEYKTLSDAEKDFEIDYVLDSGNTTMPVHQVQLLCSTVEMTIFHPFSENHHVRTRPKISQGLLVILYKISSEALSVTCPKD